MTAAKSRASVRDGNLLSLVARGVAFLTRKFTLAFTFSHSPENQDTAADSKSRAPVRVAILLSSVMGGLAFSAAGSAQGLPLSIGEIDREISLLTTPASLPLSSGVELLTGCKAVGLGAVSLCSIPPTVAIARGAPAGGLDRLFVTSPGTEIVVEATLATPGIGVDVLVNGARCALRDGTTTCPVPVGSGSDLSVDLFPSRSGALSVVAGSKLFVSSVTLRRGFASVLLSLRAHADSLETSLTNDLAVYSRFDKQVRFQTTSRADLERVFASLTTEHIPPLPDYNTVAVGADGSETRNSECPLKPTPDPDTWSHTFEECGNLAIVAGLLNGEPVFSQADINETRARIEANGSALGKIANALAANGEALGKRFQDLLARLRAKGIPLP